MKRGFSILAGAAIAIVAACGGKGGTSATGGGGSANNGGGGAGTSSSSTSSSGDVTTSSSSSTSASSTTSASSSTSASSTSSSTSASSSGGGTTGKWVTGYYVGYLKDMYPPDVIDWNGLTHLAIGAVVPGATGTLDTTLSVDAVNGPALAKQLSMLAHQHGKKVIVMIGGAGAHDAFASAASSAHRAAFVQNLKQLATDWSADGFDLDWEPLDPADQPDFMALAQALRTAMPGVLLTVPVGWVTQNNPQVDAFYGQVAAVFDQVNIMSYGMAGAWPGWQSWHSSALSGATGTTPSAVDVCVQSYLSAGVPAAKLGVGIGFYGSCWSTPVNAPKQSLGGSQIVADDNVMTFDHIMSSYYSAAAHHYDTAAHVPYLGFSSPHGPEGCTFVSYEDEQSIADKAQYVKDNGLGGTIVWNINEGYRPSQPAGQRDPLMAALATSFLQ